LPADAKKIILETIDVFKYILPRANNILVKFTGGSDNTVSGDETVGAKEKRNKKIWREAIIGTATYLRDQSSFFVDLTQSR